MKRYILTSLLVISSLLGLSFSLLAQNVATTPKLYQEANKQKMNQWVDSVYNSLTTEQRVGQLFHMIVSGNTSDANVRVLKSLINNQHIGGILTSKTTIADHAKLVNIAQEVSPVPMMISLDGEWGLSMRIANTTIFPRNMMLGAIQNDSLLYYYGREVARQCQLMGIHVNFAPALDVNSNSANPVIGIRSFGEDPQRVADLGIMYSKGLESANVMAVAKHFPGHGDTSTDSHKTLPTVSHNKERLYSYELAPFSQYIKAGLSGMMVGHLYVPALDKEVQPSSLSKKIVTDVLKDSLGFTGLTFTDGLAMRGVSVEKDHCVRALLAGNDVLLSPINIRGEYQSVLKAVEDGRISKELIEEKCKRVLAYKYILGATEKKMVDTEDLDTKLNTAYAEWLNRRLHASAITLLKDENEIIPLDKLDTRKIAAISIDAPANNDFLNRLRAYGDVTVFTVANGTELQALKIRLETYNTIIIGVHRRRGADDAAIASVAKGKDLILTFFTNPYHMNSYPTAIKAAKGVIEGYEDTNMSHDYAAQVIFGGISPTGKLPVSVGSLFTEGTGISKKKSVWDIVSLKK